jgi:hypothetical protein
MGKNEGRKSRDTVPLTISQFTAEAPLFHLKTACFQIEGKKGKDKILLFVVVFSLLYTRTASDVFILFYSICNIVVCAIIHNVWIKR